MKVIVAICGLLGGAIGWWRIDVSAGISCSIAIWLMWFGAYWFASALRTPGDITSHKAGAIVMLFGGVLSGLLYGSIGGIHATLVMSRTGAHAEPAAGVMLLLAGVGAISALAGYLVLLHDEQSGW